LLCPREIQCTAAGSYTGKVKFHDQWYPGGHDPIIDRPTFDSVQALLGNQVYRSHELVHAGDLIQCGHCEQAITGEVKSMKPVEGLDRFEFGELLDILADDLRPDTSGLAFSIVDGCIGWEADPVTMTADDLFAQEADAQQGGRAADWEDAANWLSDVLADGALPAADVKSLARQNGVGEKSLRTARERLRVVSQRKGFGRGNRVLWAVPDSPILAHTLGRASMREAGMYASGTRTHSDIERTAHGIGRGGSDFWGFLPNTTHTRRLHFSRAKFERFSEQTN